MFSTYSVPFSQLCGVLIVDLKFVFRRHVVMFSNYQCVQNGLGTSEPSVIMPTRDPTTGEISCSSVNLTEPI